MLKYNTILQYRGHDTWCQKSSEDHAWIILLDICVILVVVLQFLFDYDVDVEYQRDTAACTAEGGWRRGRGLGAF